jgi:hypothetical protein
MFAQPQFVEAEPVGIKRLLVVLGERVGERRVPADAPAS